MTTIYLVIAFRSKLINRNIYWSILSAYKKLSSEMTRL